MENIGQVKGMETVQIYVEKKGRDEKEPGKQLSGFEKIFLEPGERKRVKICLQERAFSAWDAGEERFVKRAGEYCIYAGSSLEDIRLSGEISV